MKSTIISSIASLSSKELKSSQFFLYKEKNITKAELLLTKYYEEQQEFKIRLEKEIRLERELLAASNSLAMPLGENKIILPEAEVISSIVPVNGTFNILYF